MAAEDLFHVPSNHVRRLSPAGGIEVVAGTTVCPYRARRRHFHDAVLREAAEPHDPFLKHAPLDAIVAGTCRSLHHLPDPDRLLRRHRLREVGSDDPPCPPVLSAGAQPEGLTAWSDRA